MKKILLCTLLTAACGPLLPTRAGEPEAPPPPRERLERAEEKERPQPSELRRAGPRREREVRTPADRERFRELRRERAELTARLERSRAEGRREEARELQKRLLQLDRETAELGRRPLRPGPAGPPPPAPLAPGPDARQRHLQAAIENLHAAGLHELAERLERGRENLLRWPGAPLPELAERVREEIRRLRAELEEVRHHLRRLEERLERALGPRR